MDTLLMQKKNRFSSRLIKHCCATAFIKGSYYPTLGSLSFASPFTHWQQFLPHSRGQITILSHTDRCQRTICNSHWNMQAKTHTCVECGFHISKGSLSVLKEFSAWKNWRLPSLSSGWNRGNPRELNAVFPRELNAVFQFYYFCTHCNCFHKSLKIMHDVSFHGLCSHASQADQSEGKYRLESC